MEDKEKQKLINLIFQMVLASTDDKIFCEKPRGERMAWVANNLRDFGYDTHPVGSSWGALVNKEFRESVEILKDNLDN